MRKIAQVIKAKNIRISDRVLVVEADRHEWCAVTRVFGAGYGSDHITIAFGDGYDNEDILKPDERVLVVR